jgi:hypothetical protein
MSDSPIPTDTFSRSLRAARDSQAVIKAESTVHSFDFYGNTETWVIETFRVDDGRGPCESVFLQRTSADGGMRLMLPPDVTRALARHRDQVSAAARRRQGHTLIALRRQRGDTLGNPEALKKARRRKQSTREKNDR